MTHILNIESYLLTINIEKAFDFVDFIPAILEKYGFKKTF